jgi:hypothetical protein
MNERSSNFVHSMHGLGRASDGAIESVTCKGGGIRLVGFNTIKARELLDTLNTHGKSCVCHGLNGELVIDCYDDTGDEHTVKIAPFLAENSGANRTSTFTRGAITETSYAVPTVTSQQLRSVLTGIDGALNAIVALNTLVVQTVTVSSAKLANGIHDQLQRQSLKFRRIPKLTPNRIQKVTLPKRRRRTVRTWLSGYM